MVLRLGFPGPKRLARVSSTIGDRVEMAKEVRVRKKNAVKGVETQIEGLMVEGTESLSRQRSRRFVDTKK